MRFPAGQLQINQVNIDILVKTLPKGRHGMNDFGNGTAAMAQAGLGLDNALLLAWDIWTRGLDAGRLLAVLDRSSMRLVVVQNSELRMHCRSQIDVSLLCDTPLGLIVRLQSS